MAYSRLTPCGQCGASNRIPAAHLAHRGRCGRCKAPLTALAEALPVDAEGFTEIISSATVPVLVDFWAAWCGPCLAAAPEVDKLAAEMQGRAIVLKVDTEAHPALAARYRIQSIPNFVVFRQGLLVHQQAGAAPRAQMRAWLEA